MSIIITDAKDNILSKVHFPKKIPKNDEIFWLLGYGCYGNHGNKKMRVCLCRTCTQLSI